MMARKNLAGRCRRCHRKLTHPKSLRIGLGPECAKKAWKGSTIRSVKTAYESFGNYLTQLTRDWSFHCECGLHIESIHLQPRDDINGIPLDGFAEYQSVVSVCPHCGRQIPLDKLRWTPRPNRTAAEGVPA